ncbi:hypothetical protein B0H14DRAFT_3134377 [Mycena olivaceomarginata]|nr:hypothetical protein B0H14DRAFT_3134377 [Mycena olivaceomarginata]
MDVRREGVKVKKGEERTKGREDNEGMWSDTLADCYIPRTNKFVWTKVTAWDIYSKTIKAEFSFVFSIGPVTINYTKNASKLCDVRILDNSQAVAALRAGSYLLDLVTIEVPATQFSAVGERIAHSTKFIAILVEKAVEPLAPIRQARFKGGDGMSAAAKKGPRTDETAQSVKPGYLESSVWREMKAKQRG